MAAKSNSCFWLANVKKIFSSETAWPNGAKLGKILYKTSLFNSIGPTNMVAVTKNKNWWKSTCLRLTNLSVYLNWGPKMNNTMNLLEG
jgi:hypothetical protein